MQVSWVYILFTALVAVGVLLQACVLLGMLIAMRAGMKRMAKIATMAEEHAIPALTTAKQILDELSPKLKIAAANVAEASETLREQAKNVNETMDGLLKKTEEQANRVDEMITGTLNSVAHATATVQRVVGVPVRQINAMLNGLRAGFGVLRTREPEARGPATVRETTVAERSARASG